MASEAHIGLARISYEWNDLAAAEEHARLCAQFTRQMDNSDTFASYAVLLARLRLAEGDLLAATAVLDEAETFVRQNNFRFRVPDIAAVQVLTLLRQSRVGPAADLAQTHDLPISQARVHLARGDASAALAVLEPWRQHIEGKAWVDQRLEVMILQALALQAHGDADQAVQLLLEALAVAEPGGYIRSFADEGRPMADLLSAAAAHPRMADYIARVIVGFQPSGPPPSPMIEPLTQRELEVLRLITQGFSNQEIGDRLYLALDTVKGHNRKIFGKLQVQRRTEAVARARELGLA